jgi:hypothetical protein
MLPTDSPRWDDLTRQAGLILADATRQITQPADLLPVTATAADLKSRAGRTGRPHQTDHQHSLRTPATTRAVGSGRFW